MKLSAKLCINCKHIRDAESMPTCERTAKQNPVDGVVILTPCYIERILDRGCGPDGKFWEQQQTVEAA